MEQKQRRKEFIISTKYKNLRNYTFQFLNEKDMSKLGSLNRHFNDAMKNKLIPLVEVNNY
jgi:hypothetical protein